MKKKGFYYSSITQKIILALAGFFLITFLLVHMGINLFLLPIVENHKEIFRAAAHFMGTNPIIKVFEIVLMAGFAIHIIMGIYIQFQNWRARGQRYAVYGKSSTSFGSRFMIHTGLIILAFLLLHFVHFYFVKLGIVAPMKGSLTDMQALDAEGHFYEIAVFLFKNSMIYCVLYLISFVALAVHLNHAFQSVFQTLGLNHPYYMPYIKLIGTAYAILIGVGFSIIPLYFMIIA